MAVQSPSLSWLDVSDEVKQLLSLAADHWDNPAIAEQYMNQALEVAGDNADVLVAAYRYFFYRNNISGALYIALCVMDQVRQRQSFPDHWEQLQPILNQRKDELDIRLYISAYAAYGLLLAKSGNIEQATVITSHVQSIDDRREFSAAVVHKVLTSPPEDDD